MALRIPVALTDEQKAVMENIPATSWFTPVIWENAFSPRHPRKRFAENNEMKYAMTNDWISLSVRGKRVLDLFSANGAFSIFAALAGARSVVGVEFSRTRIECAEFIASTVPTECPVAFRCGDVYKLDEYFREPFDVVLCLGGLYHVADPALVLKRIRALTIERLILQTSQILSRPGNKARFIVRRIDGSKEGMTSIRRGYGTWHCSPGCIRELLLHAGFEVLEERRPPWHRRRRFPWYLARCGPIPSSAGQDAGASRSAGDPDRPPPY